MTTTNNHVAVFVDVENIVFSLRNRFGVDANFQDIMTRCREYGRVKIARAYGQWDEKFLVREIQWLNNCGFDLMHVPTTTHKANGFTSKSKPNIVDIYMTVDAMRVLAEDESISTFVLLTGDGDFIPLVNAIKRAGKRVIALGVDRCWSDNLESAVDEFLPYSQISPTSIGLINVDEIDLDNRVMEIVKTMRAQGHETPSLQQLSEWLKTGVEGFDDRRLINSDGWYYRDLRAYLQNRLGPKGYQIRKQSGKDVLLAPDSGSSKENAAAEVAPADTEASEKEAAPANNNKKKSRGKGKNRSEDKKRGKKQEKPEKKSAKKAEKPVEAEVDATTPDVVIEAAPAEPVIEEVVAVEPEPVVEEKLTLESAQGLLLQAVTKLDGEGRNPRASIVKLTMRRLNDEFNEKDFLNAEGQRFTKFDEFLVDAEKAGIVRLEGSGVYREVYLPGISVEADLPVEVEAVAEETTEAEAEYTEPEPVATVEAVEESAEIEIPAAEAEVQEQAVEEAPVVAEVAAVAPVVEDTVAAEPALEIEPATEPEPAAVEEAVTTEDADTAAPEAVAEKDSPAEVEVAETEVAAPDDAEEDDAEVITMEAEAIVEEVVDSTPEEITVEDVVEASTPEVVAEEEPAAIEVVPEPEVKIVSEAPEISIETTVEETDANEAAVSEAEVEATEAASEVVAEIEGESVAAPIHVTDELSIEYVSTEPEEAPAEAEETLDLPPVNEVVILEDQDSPIEEEVDLPPFLKAKTDTLAEALDEETPEVSEAIADAVVEEAEAISETVAQQAVPAVTEEVSETVEAPVDATEETNPLPGTGEIDLPGEVTQQFQLREKIKAIESELGGSLATGEFASVSDEPTPEAEELGLLKPLGEIATAPLPEGLSSITEKLESTKSLADVTEADEALDIFAGVEDSQELTVEEIESIMQHNDDSTGDAALVDTTLDFDDLNDFSQEEFTDSAADITEAEIEATRGILADEEVKRQVVMWMNSYNAFPATIDALKEHCHAMRDTSAYNLSNGQVDQLVLDAVMAGILQMEPTLTTPALYNLNITKDTVAAYLDRGN